MAIAKMETTMVPVTMMVVTVVYSVQAQCTIVHNACVTLMESSHHLDILNKIMTTILTCIGSSKFLLDKTLGLILSSLMFNPEVIASKYAFYFVSLIRRGNNFIHFHKQFQMGLFDHL